MTRTTGRWRAGPLLLVVVFGRAAPVSGQTAGLPAEPIVTYLPPTVRSTALNGAAVALVGDAGAVFANPAGLATIRNIALEGAYRSLPTPEAFVATGALGWRLNKFDLGVGVRYADFGTQPAAYLGPAAPAGPAHDLLGAASLVYRRGLFAVGATGKRIERRFDGVADGGTSADVGLAIAFFDIMALAFAVQNVGGNWEETSEIPMPRLSRFGFTMNFTDPQESFRLLTVLEWQWPAEQAARFIGGGEAGVVLAGVGVVGRVAYASRSLLGAGSDVTFGATATLGRMDVDWAYREADLLGQPAHQVGLRLRL